MPPLLINKSDRILCQKKCPELYSLLHGYVVLCKAEHTHTHTHLHWSVVLPESLRHFCWGPNMGTRLTLPVLILLAFSHSTPPVELCTCAQGYS